MGRSGSGWSCGRVLSSPHRETREIREASLLLTGGPGRSRRLLLSSQGDRGDQGGFSSPHRETGEINEASPLSLSENMKTNRPG
jgi:hypothetical protein